MAGAAHGEVVAVPCVALEMPGVPTPNVDATTDAEGTGVQANLVDVEPTPEHVHVGQQVRLTTFSLGPDSHGTEAIGFGFTPLEK